MRRERIPAGESFNGLRLVASCVRGKPADHVIAWWRGTKQAELRHELQRAFVLATPRVQRSAAGIILDLARACPDDPSGDVAAWLDGLDVPESLDAEVERLPHGRARAEAWRARRRSPGLG
ncbi:MAG: hypothetical protein AB7T63_14875 [Planctomycetota bacterium]